MVIGFTMQNLDNYANFDDYFITLYPMYIPCSKTFAVRAIFRMIQTITLLPEGISCVSLPIMLFIIIANMYDRFELLGLFLRHTSYSVFRSIDETYNLELAMDEGRIPSSLTKIDEMKIKKALALDKFLSNTTLVIKRHQRLYRIAKLYGEKMNFIVSIVYLLMNSMGVIFTFFVSSITETGYYHRTFLVIILVLSDIALCWLIFCIMGELFFNMNEIIAMEIYCSPWYHLEPKDRQVILTFLTIVQRPLTIVAFGIYPINLSIFPDMVNTIYSNSQKLRTLQQRKHSR
ncbi:odorant receptor 43a-like isoform X1 [Planococcus citri]|uniref:odorant receptor 43a-like isoform X1 n=2 Tax=Planococcus citri TaxID=170843 RepID=UPI0031F7FC24